MTTPAKALLKERLEAKLVSHPCDFDFNVHKRKLSRSPDESFFLQHHTPTNFDPQTFTTTRNGFSNGIRKLGITPPPLDMNVILSTTCYSGHTVSPKSLSDAEAFVRKLQRRGKGKCTPRSSATQHWMDLMSHGSTADTA